VKRIQDSQVVLGQKRDVLVKKWNKEILCNKPSLKAIRKSKRAIQTMRRDRRNIVSDQDVYITETIKQEKEMREYKS
jgi:hypothetical protein